MSKIFRLYTGGNSTYEDWNDSQSFPYDSTSRQAIDDPDGASADHEITSIPSPFARIDLIKNAFKEVCTSDKATNQIDLDGKTIFNKMVSDTLDVAEIFFNIDKYAGKIEVLKWEPSAMLAQLKNSGIPGHAYLADALDKYMQSDAGTYNFGQLKNIYLLTSLNGPEQINIIGATSPATLFFSNANDLGYVNDIFFGQDKPFDSDYQPLYKRDFEFIKYMFALRASIPNFAGLFPEVDTYLTETFKRITDQNKKIELNKVSNVTLQEFDNIYVSGTQQNDLVEVLGHNLYQKRQGQAGETSDFLIRTNKSIARLPLVLPVDAGNRYSNLQYTTDKWGNTNKAPFADVEADLSKRRLPFDGSVHPYLTISDFLEDCIVKVPHAFNNTHYFDGHIKIDGLDPFSFLLPIKPLFFSYFSIEDLMGKMADGRYMFEMALRGSGSVVVTLRVPIQGTESISYIEYTRMYYNGNKCDISKNEGKVVEMAFTGFIMPQIRFNNPSDAIYNISCVQPNSEKTDFYFFIEDTCLYTPQKSCRCDSKDYSLKAYNYLIKGQNFDYIQVKNHYGYKGIIVPIFKQQQNTVAFEFAVDLGTSNTHIEYRMAGRPPQVFSFNHADRQLCEIFTPIKNEGGYIEDLQGETQLIECDYIPGEIGSGDYYFPTRTVLSCSKTVDWTQRVDPYTLVNLPFTYDKRANYDYNELHYNIKWGKGIDLQVMEAYVRNLMLIMRNKVLLNNGDLAQTKITWFYPISMAPNRLQRLTNTWNEAFAEYFGNGATISMTESEAPIQYFFQRYATATSLVNVDIGGGTTDIAFAKDRVINYVTSFRFATNVLFENSFSELDLTNGIVDYHKASILDLIKAKGVTELVSVFESSNNERPANMASFLFGLKDSTLLRNKGVSDKIIDFNYLLQEDEHFKIVFIIFYTSIIYHIAQIVKHLNIEVPRHISFSGNGSKVIRVISTDSHILAEYTKIIFEKILDMPYGKDLDILGLENGSNPKGSTCKGGLIGAQNATAGSKSIVFKSDCTGIVDKDDTYATINNEYKSKTITAVEDFFRFVLDDMNASFNFERNFGVKSETLTIARLIAKKDLATFLDKGIRQRENQENDVIEETFFFYPIKGVLQSISAEIYEIFKKPTE